MFNTSLSDADFIIVGSLITTPAYANIFIIKSTSSDGCNSKSIEPPEYSYCSVELSYVNFHSGAVGVFI